MNIIAFMSCWPVKSSLTDCLLTQSCRSYFFNLYNHVQHSQKSPSVQASSHRRSLHRTLSDESIYRGQRLPSLSDSVTEPTLGADVLFSCSTLPRSPTTRGVPLRRPSYKLGVKLHGRDEDRPQCSLHEMKFGQERLPDQLIPSTTTTCSRGKRR